VTRTKSRRIDPVQARLTRAARRVVDSNLLVLAAAGLIGMSALPVGSALTAGARPAGHAAVSNGLRDRSARRESLSAKPGVCVWKFPGVDAALADSRARWYLTWATTHAGIVNPPDVQFVPMIWGAASVTASALAQAKKSGPNLLTFNEPDLASQSNMSVAQALALWPRLMATGLRLASPAVASGAATPGGWLDQFMHGVASHHYRVNFIALHWYGGDFRTGPAVAELEAYLEATYHRYHRPIWLTEYSLINFSGGHTTYPSEGLLAAFVRASEKMLDRLPFVRRYAWFALPSTASGPSTGLFAPGAKPTAAGVAFEDR
jgi:hypothetical protein